MENVYFLKMSDVYLFLCFLEKYFTKDIPDKLKMTLKGGAAVDPESGRYSLQIMFPSYYHRAR